MKTSHDLKKKIKKTEMKLDVYQVDGYQFHSQNIVQSLACTTVSRETTLTSFKKKIVLTRFNMQKEDFIRLGLNKREGLFHLLFYKLI